MCKDVLITGVSVKTQMIKAKDILENIVIPKEELFQVRKKNGTLSKELLKAIKSNA